MKKSLVVVSVVAVLAIGTVAFAHGGFGGYGMMGYGPGYGMMGYGPGYGMMGYGGTDGTSPEFKEFLDKTADLRRDLAQKRFEYMEAYRTGDAKKAEKVAGEIETLTAKVRELAPATGGAFAYNRPCR